MRPTAAASSPPKAPLPTGGAEKKGGEDGEDEWGFFGTPRTPADERTGAFSGEQREEGAGEEDEEEEEEEEDEGEEEAKGGEDGDGDESSDEMKAEGLDKMSPLSPASPSPAGSESETPLSHSESTPETSSTYSSATSPVSLGGRKPSPLLSDRRLERTLSGNSLALLPNQPVSHNKNLRRAQQHRRSDVHEFEPDYSFDVHRPKAA